MKKEARLFLNHFEAFMEYAQFPKEDWAKEADCAVDQLEGFLNIFLCENFRPRGRVIREPFKIEQLLALPEEKKEEFECLVQELIDHSTCLEYFLGWINLMDI
jgi:hypothetical protein